MNTNTTVNLTAELINEYLATKSKKQEYEAHEKALAALIKAEMQAAQIESAIIDGHKVTVKESLVTRVDTKKIKELFGDCYDEISTTKPELKLYVR